MSHAEASSWVIRMRWGFMASALPYEYDPTSATEGFARSGMVVEARIKLTIIVVRNPPLGHLHSKCLLRAGYSFRSSAATLIEVEIDETQREGTDADKVGNTTRLYEAQQQAAARLREVGEKTSKRRSRVAETVIWRPRKEMNGPVRS